MHALNWTDDGRLALLAMRDAGKDWDFIGHAFGKSADECRAVFNAVMGDLNESEGVACEIVELRPRIAA